MKKSKLFPFIGLTVGAIGISVLLNLVWVAYIDSPAKMDLDKTVFVISNSVVGLILVVIALLLIKGSGRKHKIELGQVVPEIDLREAAYKIWRRLPIRERAISEIKKKHPKFSDESISDAISKAEALNSGASMEAERFRSKTATKKQGITDLEKSNPGFPKSLYKTAWGDGMHDTR